MVPPVLILPDELVHLIVKYLGQRRRQRRRGIVPNVRVLVQSSTDRHKLIADRKLGPRRSAASLEQNGEGRIHVKMEGTGFLGQEVDVDLPQTLDSLQQGLAGLDPCQEGVGQCSQKVNEGAVAVQRLLEVLRRSPVGEHLVHAVLGRGEEVDYRLVAERSALLAEVLHQGDALLHQIVHTDDAGYDPSRRLVHDEDVPTGVLLYWWWLC